jgi:tRNA(Ile2) C34 agmatinyltransferase TiaS
VARLGFSLIIGELRKSGGTISIFFAAEQWNHLHELETGGLEVKVEVEELVVSELEFKGEVDNNQQASNSRNSGKGKFKCRVCGKTYSQEASLSEHMRFHEGAFSCPVCGRQLSKKSHLNRHLRNIHGVDKTTPSVIIERTSE